ncbi:hypothetical protein BBP40_001151 [Aspergillus hancockii]|nr:hypothetical protein BBP40_001151 [Aspergillus hancockii]
MVETDTHKDLDQFALHEGFEEPDLPPTPTQLGLERPPARPKGLLSSSPTAQSRNRGKRRTTDTEQSPSKLRSVHYGEGEEVSSDSGETMGQVLFSEPFLKKRKLKNDLFAEVQQLKDDISELENWSNSIRHYGENKEYDLSRLMSILAEEPSHSHATSVKPRSHDVSMSTLISTLLPFSTKSPRIALEEPLAVNPFALDELSQTEPYLTVFAPLNLRAYLSTYREPESGVYLERHTLKLSTQPPFPSQFLNLSINYETNPETQSILSVSVPTGTLGADSNVPLCLRQWIDSRLANPLLKLNLSGLCWGINRYWETAISRAQLWSRLEEQFRGLIVNRGGSIDTAKPGDDQKLNMQILTTLDLRRILPHLKRTSMLFDSRSEPPLKVHLSCELTLDQWAGEPQLVPEISVSAPSRIDGSSGRKIEQDAKRLFHAILGENQSSRIGPDVEVNADMIVQATEGVLGALFGVNAEGLISGGKARR